MKKRINHYWSIWQRVAMGLLLAGVLVGTAASAIWADISAPPQQSIEAAHGMHIVVKMIGLVTQATDLQIICVLKHDPAGDKYIDAMKDLDARLGGVISSLRQRGEFVGEVGETLLITPPDGVIGAKRVLMIGVGEERMLTLDSLRLAATISIRETLRIGVEHVSFAATLRDQGSTRIDVGDADAAFAKQIILAYDTAKRMQAQGLSPKADIPDFTIEAGPAFFNGAIEKVKAAVIAANEEIAHRTNAPYKTTQGEQQ
jgi:hypothetical protein